MQTVAPEDGWNVPVLHGVHEELLAMEYCPGGQMVQLDSAYALANVPAGQPLQEVDPGALSIPLGHGEHALAPTVLEYVFAGQAAQ